MTRSLDVSSAAVVITGSGSGIGRAAAKAFASRGAAVLVSDLSKERAEIVAAEITSAGGRAFAQVADVTSENDLLALRERCLDHFGHLEVVMNNVGVIALGAPESLPDEAWSRTFDINVLSIARSNRVFLPHLLEQGRGHVVNTASASGLLAHGFDRLPYVASKHAIVGLSEALALYLGPKNIGVTCLCPSGVITNILEQITVYGESRGSPRAPDHPIVTAEELADAAVDAITSGRFLVLTAPEIQRELRERSADIEAYLQKRIAEQSA
jgi:NAD(P)-dependent dehydrogenase (short-subunit alcohol dehydrogenase family)